VAPPRVFRGQDLESWCRETGREDLLEEWDDPAKGPHQVTRGTKEKAWWKCGKEECGYRWGATVGSRTSGSRCPACSGRVPTATHNFEVYCEETGRQELLGEWADRSSRPKDFTPGSKVKVPWECGKCEWVWEASMHSRTSSKPTGCPACAGHVVTATNNLAVWCGKHGREDLLLVEWAHPDKAPTDFTPGSKVKVPWECRKCGWGWEASMNSRTRNKLPSGCPKCNPGARAAK
jgi:predicted Zn-ribbon and HTH transcriptional regulator